MRMKATLIRTLVDRAWKLCSTYALWHIEIENIKSMMMTNGYTESYIFQQIKRYLEKVYTVTTPSGPFYGPDRFKVYIKLPYLSSATNKLEKTIGGCLRKLNVGGVQLVVINQFSRIFNWFSYKDKTPKLMRHNVVYKIECSCGKYYVGMTERNLILRLKEHLKSSGKLTTVGEHLRENPTHIFDFEKVEVLGQTDKFRIKYLETLYIQKFATTGLLLNDAESSVPLNLFNIPIRLT